MLKNDKINMVLALLIAVGLWFYVLGIDNPQTTIPVRGVPIEMVHADTLEERGLVLLSASDETVNVSISGKRTDVNKVGKKEIKAVCDLADLEKGTHQVKVQVSAPDAVEVEDTNKETIEVVIDKLVTEEKPVAATVSGESSDDQEPYIVQLSTEGVAVTGAKSLVDKVVRLTAELDSQRVDTNMKAFNVPLIPVDKNGAKVEGVKLAEKSVSVTAVMLSKKTVELQVPLRGEETGDADRTVVLPKTITIKGTDDVLSNIRYIVTETLDVSTIYEDTELPLTPILPEGVEVARASTHLVAKVTVRGMETKIFSYKKESIIFEGVTEDLIVTASEVSLKLTVSGKADVIADLSADDFYFVADVSGLRPGKHKVKLVCRYDQELSDVSFTPQTVEVVIEEKADEDEPAAGNAEE